MNPAMSTGTGPVEENKPSDAGVQPASDFDQADINRDGTISELEQTSADILQHSGMFPKGNPAPSK